MIKLNVWLAMDEKNPIKAGEIICADPDMQRGGAIVGQFRYSREYLASSSAFALDPIHLPLKSSVYDADRPGAGIHGVFEDSLPDDWGRKLLIKKNNLARSEQRTPSLLKCLGGNGLGALWYSENEPPPHPGVILESRCLDELQELARKFEEDASSDNDDLALLFQAGSSPGGARPKALVQNEGKLYLAKFPSVKDTFDMVSLEAATMALAEKAGINVALTRCVPCGSRKVLLVERFDVNDDTRRRNNVLTFQTLLSADGFYNLAYHDMAEVLRKVTADPKRDLVMLFRQMVFNVLMGNTDDHLKNFSMLYNGEWRLSPAYDLLPNVGRNNEHVLRIHTGNRIPDRDDVVNEAIYFGIKQQKVINDILSNILRIVSGWEEVFRSFGVPDKDMEILAKDINKRIEKLS